MNNVIGLFITHGNNRKKYFVSLFFFSSTDTRKNKYMIEYSWDSTRQIFYAFLVWHFTTCQRYFLLKKNLLLKQRKEFNCSMNKWKLNRFLFELQTVNNFARKSLKMTFLFSLFQVLKRKSKTNYWY